MSDRPERPDLETFIEMRLLQLDPSGGALASPVAEDASGRVFEDEMRRWEAWWDLTFDLLDS